MRVYAHVREIEWKSAGGRNRELSQHAEGTKGPWVAANLMHFVQIWNLLKRTAVLRPMKQHRLSADSATGGAASLC